MSRSAWVVAVASALCMGWGGACVDRNFPAGYSCDPAFGCPPGQSCTADSVGSGFHCTAEDAGVLDDGAVVECELEEEQACYTGPVGTDEQGVCQPGIRTCQQNLSFGSCEGEVTPDSQCEGRECGSDGCGDSCGSCEAQIECNQETGQCLRDVMVTVSGGTFSMGSPDTETGHSADEPAHNITLSPYRIDAVETTNQAYLQCVLDGASCESPTSCDSGVPSWTGAISFPDGLEHHPVVCVTHAMAADYCGWADKRLCTEAEWERAAVGDSHRVYPFGDTFPVNPDDFVNCAEGTCADGFGTTSPVGSFPNGATPGTMLFDMAGNTSEWILDYYDASFYSIGPQSDPKGPCDGVAPCDSLFVRGHRGGNFGSDSLFIRCSKRGQRAETSREPFIGFRCCQDVL